MDIIKDIIFEAGKILKERYFESFSYNDKGRFDLVSEVDLEIEEMLINSLKSINQGVSFYSEECGDISGCQNEMRWIIDPVDGTANFIFGIPYFNISLSLESNNRIIEAYVYNPLTDELYCSSEKNGKAFLNGKQITVSDTCKINRSLVTFGFSANIDNINRYYSEWPMLFKGCRKGLGVLSPALNICNVARGRTDCFIDFGSNMEGQAGAAFILKNAGGIAVNYDFSEWDYRTKGIIAVNSKLLARLKENKEV